MQAWYELQERRWHVVDGKRVRRFQTVPEGASLTQKHQAADTDINLIVKRFGLTGMVPQRLNALNLGVFEDVFDFQSAQNAIVEANRAFLSIDADIRARFHNDPQRFMDFTLDPANEAELRKLGLWNALVEKPPEVIQKVEIVGGAGASIPPSGVPPRA